MGDVAKLVGFMPWLQLEKPVRVAGFSFVPFTVSGAISDGLEGLKDIFPAILSNYVDQMEPQSNCIVVIDETAQNPNEAWNISVARIEAAHSASSLLFLATWSKNEYFTPIGSYVNDVDFQLYFQRFVGSVDRISFHRRKRDGSVFSAGQKQGSIHFTKPLSGSGSSLNRIKVDLGFLQGLSTASLAGSSVVSALKVVLPFVRLANTDSDLMNNDAEVALLAFAFEQYFQANTARDLATKFDDLLILQSKTTVQTAKDRRPDIYPDPPYTNAQLNWPVAKMWMNEFHQYRSTIVHGQGSSNRTWGWNPLEHLVMAALTFPLIVKLDLAKEGHYSLTLDDKADCQSVDLLLSQSNWSTFTGSSTNTKWQNILCGERRLYALKHHMSISEDERVSFLAELAQD